MGKSRGGPLFRILAVLLVLVLMLPAATFVQAAAPQVLTVGPIDPASIYQGNPNTGFPGYYGDDQGTKLSLLPLTGDLLNAPTQVYVVPDPANPYSVFLGFDSEAFYYDANAKFDTSAGKGLALFGVEAGFTNLFHAIPADEMVFTRIRFKIAVPAPGDYRIQYPYGDQTFTVTQANVDSGKGLNSTTDVGLGRRNFIGAASGPINHFMHQPNAPAGWIGDGVTLGPVNDGPLRNNIIITPPPAVDLGAGVGSALVISNFTISGRLLSNIAPLASFTKALAPLSGVAPCVVTLADTSTGTPTAWLWDFGDGSTSTLQHPSVKSYAAAGNYTISLTVTNAAGTSTSSQTVSVFSPPVAAFTHTAVNGLPPIALNFADTSSGNPSAWAWDFGDGTSSTLQNPSKTYNNAGSYNVKLTVTNASGTASVTHPVSISPNLVTSFAESVSSGNVPLTVAVTENSSGNVISRLWDFGDGNTSTLQAPPPEVYTTAGNYTLTLTVNDAAGSASMSRLIRVYSPPASAFTKSLASGTAPLAVKFTDTSTGNPTAWQWYFGDGTGSTLENPVKTFTANGIFNVTLVASNPAGTSSVSQTVIVSTAFFTPFTPGLTLGPIDPASLWQGNPSTGFPGYYADDQGTSLGLIPMTGDGLTVPTQVYAPVDLTLNPDGTLKYPYESFLGFGAEGFYYDANAKFTTSVGKGLALFGIEAGYTNLFHGIPGDEMVFARLRFRADVPVPGDYLVQHPYGTQTVTVTANNIARHQGLNSTTDVLVGLRDFYGPSSGIITRYLHQTVPPPPAGWIGDGVSIGPVTGSPTGFNKVRITGPVGINLDGAGNNFIEIDQFTVSGRLLTAGAPIAGFTSVLAPPIGGAPGIVTFTDTSTNTPSAWFWDFGDGTTSTLQNPPAKTYAAAGNYTVTLTVTNAAGTSTTSQNLSLYSTPVPGFSANPTAAVLPAVVNFTDSSTGNITGWLWNFGDGTSSTLPNPVKLYAAPGLWNVTLTATNPVGSVVSAAQTIIVNTPIPGPSALTAAVFSATQVDLGWTVNSANETGFNVERSTDGSTFIPLPTGGLLPSVTANTSSYSDFTVTQNNSYYYRVRAVNALGTSPASNTVPVSVSIPAVPTALTALAVSPARVDLAWTDASNNETGFNLERSTDGSNFAPLNLTSANVASYSDTTVVGVGPYYYRVSAQNVRGTSAVSNVAQVSLAAPAAPALLTATPFSASRIDLAWTDNSNNETSFAVERSSTPGFNPGTVTALGSVAANVLVYGDTTAATGNTYFYRINAVNGLGISASNVLQVALALPAAPSALTATLVAGPAVNLAWTDNSNNETGFNILRSTNNIAFASIGAVSANTSAYSDAAVTNGVFFYQIVAANPSGLSTPSNTASATVALPAAPSGLTAKVVKINQVTLSWTDNSSNETAFRLERATDAAFTTALVKTAVPAKGGVGTVLNFDDTTVAANLPYYYRVFAVNALLDSLPSNVVQTAASVPAAATALTTAIISPVQIDLSWTDNASNETAVTLQRAADAAFSVNLKTYAALPANTTAAVDTTTVVPGATYFYRVFFQNALGQSAASNVVTVTLPNPAAPSAAPTNLISTKVVAGRIDLKWNDNSNNETGFNVQRALDAGFTQGLLETTVRANTNSFSDRGAVSGVTFFYRVFALNPAGPSNPSNTISATPPPAAGAPAPPQGITAQILVGSIEVQLVWEDSSHDASSITIERADDTAFTLNKVQFSVGAGLNTYRDVTGVRGKTYYYHVIAVNPLGSTASPTFTVKADLPASPPANLTASQVAETQVDLVWTDTTNNSTGWKVDRATSADFSVGLTTFNVSNPAFQTPPGMPVITGPVTFSDTTIQPPLSYFYRVYSVNDLGASPSPALVSVDTIGSLIPLSPSNLVAYSAAPGKITLNFTDNSNNETGFQVQRSADGITFSSLALISANSANFTDNNSGTQLRYYRMGAFNDAGDSQPSAVVSAVPLSAVAVNGSNNPSRIVNTEGLTGNDFPRVDSSGKTQNSVKLSGSGSASKHSLDIPIGTTMKSATGDALGSLTMAPVLNLPPAPPQKAVVVAQEMGPGGATFDPPITLTLSFDPANLPAGVSKDSLAMAFWDGTKWVTLPAIVDAVANTVSAKISHFTTYAIMGTLAAPALAVFPTPVATVAPAPVITTTVPLPVTPAVPGSSSAPVVVPPGTAVPSPVLEPSASPAAPLSPVPDSAPNNLGLIFAVAAAAVVAITVAVFIARKSPK